MEILTAEGPAGDAGRASAGVALVLEWFWAAHPLARSALAAHAGAFWSDGVDGLPELLVLAARAGALQESEEAALLAGIAAAAAEPSSAPRLASESASARAAIVARLRALAAGPQLRREYLELVAALSETVREEWAARGRAAVELAVGQLATELAARSFVDALGISQAAGRAELVRVLARLELETPVLVAPSARGEGVVVLDLDTVLFVGVPVQRDLRFSEARAQELARRARALGDPTRLSILDVLGRAPTSVGALAVRFRLAQPTVSNHVRVLREAGLVTDATTGTRRALTLVPGGLAQLLDELGELTEASGLDELTR